MTFICEIVALALPLLLTMIDFDNEFPTTMLPKLTDDGFKDKTGAGGVLAVAINVTVFGEFVAVLTMFRVPESVPAVWGSTLTLIAVLCPGERATGSAGPDALNPDPVAVN